MAEMIHSAFKFRAPTHLSFFALTPTQKAPAATSGIKTPPLHPLIVVAMSAAFVNVMALSLLTARM